MKKIITRIQARHQGLVRYFTNEPCKNGHISERYTSTGSCIACQKNYYATDWYKEMNRRNGKKYRASNPDHREYMREYMKQYRETEEGRANMDRATKKYKERMKQESNQ